MRKVEIDVLEFVSHLLPETFTDRSVALSKGEKEEIRATLTFSAPDEAAPNGKVVVVAEARDPDGNLPRLLDTLQRETQSAVEYAVDFPTRRGFTSNGVVVAIDYVKSQVTVKVYDSDTLNRMRLFDKVTVSHDVD